MKAITVHQPFAEMILRGVKRIENRSWYTNYRGPLVIHAGAACEGNSIFPTRALVGLVTLADCRPIGGIRQHVLFGGEPMDLTGATGPWCWCLETPLRFTRPIVCSGRLGLWNVCAELQALIEAQRACAKSG